MLKRHVPATTTVEVYRLFKLRDLGIVIRQSTDPVINALGEQVYRTAHDAVEPYMEQQNALAAKAKKKTKVKKVK
jgi:hypothetical protein